MKAWLAAMFVERPGDGPECLNMLCVNTCLHICTHTCLGEQYLLIHSACKEL